GRLVHGTTIGTNAILERRGAVTALLTTGGFRDLLEIGRTRRMAPNTLFDLKFRRPPPLVPRPLRFDVPGRLLASGEIFEPLDREALRGIASVLAAEGVRSVAVCYLHSYANPVHEEQTRGFLAELLPGVSVSLSHEVVPEYREFERMSTTVLNAYIAPLLETYLAQLEAAIRARGCSGGLFVMASGGGVMSVARAKRFPVQTVLSGPAGGVTDSVLMGRAIGASHLITYDMGGTSTDVCMVRDLRARVTTDNVITGLPLKVPQVDINTVGAGGGSVAWVDPDGQLRVGPRSAGSRPGPICYGRGGSEVTVTDANLLLQRLAMKKPLGGKIRPVREAVRPAIRSLADRVGVADEFVMADGIIRIAVAKMVASIREISIARGHDPRECVLVAFGGAGPMHATQIAEELGISDILVPPLAGNLSALGLLASDIRHELAQTLLARIEPPAMGRVAKAFRELTDRARDRLKAEGFLEDVTSFERSLDIRYRGQAFEVNIPVEGDEVPASEALQRFHTTYARMYGHANEDQEAEIVNVRLGGVARTPKPALCMTVGSGDPVLEKRWVFFHQGIEGVPVYDRDRLPPEEEIRGPGIIEETGATTVIFPGWICRRDAQDNLRLAWTRH
ncbi:MAG: hydantoinase/oxoprolinase family protein, partial [Candidatus Rokubacteria bacterium]|nr:hydantoinase/oxoprolinase family protein [Candidatus Rokubacteria bacterium]